MSLVNLLYIFEVHWVPESCCGRPATPGRVHPGGRRQACTGRPLAHLTLYIYRVLVACVEIQQRCMEPNAVHLVTAAAGARFARAARLGAEGWLAGGRVGWQAGGGTSGTAPGRLRMPACLENDTFCSQMAGASAPPIGVGTGGCTRRRPPAGPQGAGSTLVGPFGFRFPCQFHFQLLTAELCVSVTPDHKLF